MSPVESRVRGWVYIYWIAISLSSIGSNAIDKFDIHNTYFIDSYFCKSETA